MILLCIGEDVKFSNPISTNRLRLYSWWAGVLLWICKRLRVETVFATQRAAMECHQSGNTLSVGSQAMSANPYYVSSIVHRLQI